MGEEFTPTRGAGGGGFGQMIVVFGMIFAIMYFLMIRPQQKKQAEHRRMLDGLGPGDQVLTSGGLFGIVSKIREDKVWLDPLLDALAENLPLLAAGDGEGFMTKVALLAPPPVKEPPVKEEEAGNGGGTSPREPDPA